MDISCFKREEEGREIFPISLTKKNQKFLDGQSAVNKENVRYQHWKNYCANDNAKYQNGKITALTIFSSEL